MQPARKWNDVGTIREALLRASSFLRDAGVKEPPFEAELMIRHCYGWDRTRFLVSLHEPIGQTQLLQLQELCERRSRHEPLQYLFGQQEFYGRSFQVGPGVLIPRPETEILVEQVLLRASRLWPSAAPLHAADIGTGSGAIAVTLACERPNWRVTTVDLSPDAIAIARGNADRFGAHVRFLQGDLVEPLLEQGENLDILVSNPPYIPSRDVDALDQEVRAYEPRLALDGGDDGLDCYRRLCAALPRLAKDRVLVAFEVGIHQARDVGVMLSTSGVIDEVEIIPDLAGIERVVIGWRN